MQTLLKQTQAYALLKNEIQNGRYGHAYLLKYDDARNLRTALKLFAKLFFDCDKKETAAQKRISNLIDAENFSDCLCYPEPNKKISVDDAEKIREECTLNPVESDKKVLLIGDFAEANTQTQNKLLKLLEEPPQGVVFLLGATTVFPVLTTVLSRVRTLEIQPFKAEDIEACLTRLYGDAFDTNALSVCAAASNGSLGEAQTALEDGEFNEFLQSVFSLCLSPVSKLPSLARKMGEAKRPKEFLSLLRIVFRDALLIKTGVRNQKLLLANKAEEIQAVAKKFTAAALLYAQEAISEAEKQVKFNAVFPQCIELCMAKIFEKNKAITQ